MIVGQKHHGILAITNADSVMNPGTHNWAQLPKFTEEVEHVHHRADDVLCHAVTIGFSHCWKVTGVTSKSCITNSFVR